MLLVYFHIHFSPVMSLAIFGGILASGVIASILRPEKHEEAAGDGSEGAEE